MTTPSVRRASCQFRVAHRDPKRLRHRLRRRLRHRVARRLLRAAAILGIQVPPRDPLAASQVGNSAGQQPGLSLPERVASELDAAAQPGVITLLTGPSGVGKSRALRSLHARLRTRRQRVAIVHMLRPTPDRRPLACASSERLDRWLTQLARAGLADAALLPVRACDLSAGQHARLLVARAMLRLTPRAPATPATPAEAGPSPTLIIDEYASTLDVLTARLLTVSLSRWSRRAGVRVIVASARDELAPALQRDLPRAHLRVVTLTHAGLAPMTQEARS